MQRASLSFDMDESEFTHGLLNLSEIRQVVAQSREGSGLSVANLLHASADGLNGGDGKCSPGRGYR